MTLKDENLRIFCTPPWSTKPEGPLTGQVDGLEAAHIDGSQFIDGGNAGGRQDFLQEVARPQTPHQAGELALGRRRPHVPVHGAHHRRVGGARAAWCTVDVVELEEREHFEPRELVMAIFHYFLIIVNFIS